MTPMLPSPFHDLAAAPADQTAAATTAPIVAPPVAAATLPDYEAALAELQAVAHNMRRSRRTFYDAQIDFVDDLGEIAEQISHEAREAARRRA